MLFSPHQGPAAHGMQIETVRFHEAIGRAKNRLRRTRGTRYLLYFVDKVGSRALVVVLFKLSAAEHGPVAGGSWQNAAQEQKN